MAVLVFLPIMPVSIPSRAYTMSLDFNEVIGFYSYDKSLPLEDKLILKEENQWYRRYELTYESQGDTVYAAYFEPRKSEKLPAVIGIHGMFSGKEDEFWGVADFMAKRGIAVLMPSLPYHHRRSKGPDETSGWEFIAGSPKMVRNNLRRAVIDVHRALDWLTVRENVDEECICITGVSLGGMVSMLAYKTDPRFKGGAFLVAGGGFYDLLMHSENIVLRSYRRFSKVGITDIDKTADVLILADPAAIPDIWVRPTFMLNGTLDKVFPVNEVLHAARSFGNVKLVWLESPHFCSMPGAQYLLVDFICELVGIPLELQLIHGMTLGETVLNPVPGDLRLWIKLVPSKETKEIDGLCGFCQGGYFGIHLINRLTPTVIVTEELWEAYRMKLANVPASFFVVNSMSSDNIAFALSYIRSLERSNGGVYVIQAANSGIFREETIDNEEIFPVRITWLDPLDIEIAWSLNLQMWKSGLKNLSVFPDSGFQSDNVNDIEGYLFDRIKKSEMPPLSTLADDAAVDMRWAEPPT